MQVEHHLHADSFGPPGERQRGRLGAVAGRRVEPDPQPYVRGTVRGEDLLHRPDHAAVREPLAGRLLLQRERQVRAPYPQRGVRVRVGRGGAGRAGSEGGGDRQAGYGT
jgi:hypothetical protein